MEIRLKKRFDKNTQLDADDVRAVKRALNWLGYYFPYKEVGMTDIPDQYLFDSLREFQKSQSLEPSGRMELNGTTLIALNEAIYKKVRGK